MRLYTKTGGTAIFSPEIQNPDIIPPGMSVEQFKASVSRICNPVIARVFSLQTHSSRLPKRRHPEPQWEEMGTVLQVTFFPHPEIALGLSRDQVGIKSGSSRD